jgi:serine protease AprX
VAFTNLKFRRLPVAVAFLALALAGGAGGNRPAHAAAGPVDVIVVGPGAAQAAAKHGTVRGRLAIVGGVSATVRSGELAALAAERGVTSVAPSRRMIRTGLAASTPALATNYPLADNAPRAWDWGFDGRGVGIAIIDSGVAAGPDFGSRLVQVRLPGQDGSLDDVHGHGTLVAGFAAGSSADGRFKGIAPAANIYALNVSRGGTAVYSSDVITALNWVFENAHTYNIRVVNLSVSEIAPSSYKQNVLNLAVERLWASGVMVVVAAGNNGTAPDSVNYSPANDPLVFTVGGLDDKGTARLGDDTIATFSARGTTMDGIVKPDILAPGRLVASVLKPGSYLDTQAPAANRVPTGYVKISGTSFAAPQVAGAAALMFQMHPDWSPDEIKATIIWWARTVQAGGLTSLDIGSTVNLTKPNGRANQGVPALVCRPNATCLTDTTIASVWDSSTWNSSTWNSSTWNSSTWNSSTWNSSTWNFSSTWNSSTWNSSTWNGGSNWSHTSWN